MDLSAYVLILLESFSSSPEIGAGLWRGTHRWDDLIFNSERSFHTYPGLTLPGIETASKLQPFKHADGILSIEPAPIPDAERSAARTLMAASGASDDAIDKVTHYTGMLSLHDSWAETYGYFEIRARVPGAVGYWPAFWLSPGTKGWPPEIDVFEIDGRGRRGPPVTEFSATVHFDAIDPMGGALARPRIDNPHNRIGGASEQPVERQTPSGPRWSLGTDVKTRAVTKDLSDGFYVWGLEWTPDVIVWYFGKTADSLEEVYRTPTPPDLHSPLYVIANVEIGGLMAGDIAPKGPPRDSLDIDYVKVYARRPVRQLTARDPSSETLIGTAGSDHIVGTLGDDVVHPGAGFDLVELGAGRDEIHLARNDGNAVISGFGHDDLLALSGYHQTSAQLFETAFQVGADTWIIDPGTPFYPRTLILRNFNKSDLLVDQITNGPAK